MMSKTRFGKLVFLLILIAGLISACDEIQASQKYTIKGTSTKTPFHIKSTFTPTQEPPPTFTPSDTPTITLAYTSSPTTTETLEITETPTLSEPSLTSSPQPYTATPKVKTSVPEEKATVKVSLTTNCRTGPGISYPRLTPLRAGKVATLIGRDKTYSYWIIKDPGNTGRDCWLWGYYATTTGNTKDLKVYYAPDQTPKSSNTAVPTAQKTTPAPTKTPKPILTPKTPLPTNTPNLTPATYTNTPLPPTITPTPSDTPIPSDTPLPSNTPPPSNTPESMYCSYTSAVPAEEQQIFDLINKARRKAGLNELTMNQKLVTAAREHGQDMTCHGTYSHTSTDGTKAWERIGLAMKDNKNWCYSHCCCGEIFMGGGSPESAFNWWMTHKPVYKDGLNIHAWTILGQYYNRMGVGVIYYHNPNTGVTRKFYTVDFYRK
jgi:uncharacterized protein YkwD